jgi:hypothetical protein
MGTSYLGRSIVRASAMAFALTLARVTIGTAPVCREGKTG